MIDKGNLIVVGAFPPPVYGMAAINQAIFEFAGPHGWHVSRLSTAINSLESGLLSRLQRLMVMMHVWGHLLKSASPGTIVYVSLSGGWGQVYDAISLLIVRLLGARLFLHHHSVAYLTKKNRLAQLLFIIAGGKATHVVLCQKMRTLLQEKYGWNRILVLSNLAFIPTHPQEKERKMIRSIGFMSNITAEKGGWEFVELSRAIRSRSLALNSIAAGPCHEKELSQALLEARQAGSLEWRGAVYGEEKHRFFHDVDAFIFPTKYANEAEPLVVWEALSAGVPVIAFGRGCIPAQIGQAGGAISEEGSFVDAALEILEGWLNDPQKYQQCIRAGREQYRAMREKANFQLQDLLKSLAADKEVAGSDNSQSYNPGS
ncbi:MAG: glycosyltransferase [Chloroflexi bacterium]|nr:glycosyltransferase [Chloroflexota bacterium]